MDSPLIPGLHSHLLGTLDPYRLGTTLRNSPAKGRMGCDFCDFCYAHPTSNLGSQPPPALKKSRPRWKMAAISVISVIFGVSLASEGANCSREMWLPSKSNQVPRAKSELEFAFAPWATVRLIWSLLDPQYPITGVLHLSPFRPSYMTPLPGSWMPVTLTACDYHAVVHGLLLCPFFAKYKIYVNISIVEHLLFLFYATDS